MIEMKRPRTNQEIINGVINQEISEEKYFKDRSDSAGRLILDLPELLLLKQDHHLLAKFLLSFSRDGRLKILLTKEMIGMQQKRLIEKYGISCDAIRKLKGQHKLNKKSMIPEIRRIDSTGPAEYEILAALAIFTRIPISWLQEENPLIATTTWNLHHFHTLHGVHFTFEQFTNYLKIIEEKALLDEKHISHTRPKYRHVYDVRGIILKLNSKEIYLRTSIYEKGGIVVELFGERDQLNDFNMLKKILDPFGPIQVGYCETVIDNHINMMMIAKSRAIEIDLPVEFKQF